MKLLILLVVAGSVVMPRGALSQMESDPVRWRLPDDPLGNRIAQLLDVLSEEDDASARDFVENVLHPSFLEMGPVEVHLEEFAKMRGNLGAFEVDNIELHSPTRGELILRTPAADRILLSVEIEEIEPYRIAGVGLKPYDQDLEIPDFADLVEVGEYLDNLAASGKFSGVVLVKQGEETPFREAYGMADKRRGIENRLDTPFNVGSITKSFTAVAVMQLVEAGKIGLDDLLGKYILEFPAEIGNTVTVRHLLAMESGFGDYFGSPEFRSRRTEIRTIDDFIDIFKRFDLEFEPGTDRRYSNVGYVILGGIIEKASGMTYFDYVQKHIFEAAGMTGSSFSEYADPAVAMGYTNDGKSGTRDYSEDYLDFFTPLGNPSGGSFSTADDLWRFNTHLLWNRLLSKESTTLLLNFFEEGGEPRSRYGVAGGAPGASAVSFTDRDLETTVIVLSNYDEPLGERIGQAIFRMQTRQ